MFGQTMKLFLAASLLSYAAVDAKVYFTSPEIDTWTAGSTHEITWEIKNEAPSMPTMNIMLFDGEDKDLKIARTVTGNIDSSKLSYEWTIPKDLVEGTYVISGCYGNECVYSHSFKIDSTYKSSSHAASASSTSTSSKSDRTESSATKTSSSDSSKKTESPKSGDKSSKSDKESETESSSKATKTESTTSVSSSSSSTTSPKAKSDEHKNDSNAVALPMIFVSFLALASSFLALA
ncbi:hypothetical protein K493DRAFT_339604 [Basidiobolus meristosporus CBS 931.73]|uniref:Yeast cell wall synthesis Kre9/Knh1-like N-terminal domain-containing protein n=1 Tax=Basidiobolus meristosporus CBS 931.73 TaxID=1314790 RepID=A0A1Y1XZ68_9FUNG|nr:hypothetical protein K493DRAFT_339604 [Basidiobolus meristosporus CBS 931.73]|eukprot:ORX91031.1 hypothetical protein K493DRAFT_339604 [Basidiobolus meristosporus CBS 931.73]